MNINSLVNIKRHVVQQQVGKSLFLNEGLHESNDKPWTSHSSGVAWGSVGLFLAVVIGYIWMLTSIVNGSLSLLKAAGISTVLLYLAFTVVHEAGHGNIAHEVTWMKPLERLMGWVLTIPFLFIPFAMFSKVHDYHHAFTNEPDRDPDHWISGSNGFVASLKSFTVTFKYVWLVATRFKNDPVIAPTHKSSLIYFLISMTITLLMLFNGLGLELLLVGIVPAFLASFVLGTLFDWIPHQPARQQGRYKNTKCYLFPGLRFLTLGQNYHHIHHLYPRVPWYRYHLVFDALRPQLEGHHAPIDDFNKSSDINKNKVLSRSELSSKELPSNELSVIPKKLTLRVRNIANLTKDSVAITFEKPRNVTLPYSAGQYITVSKLIGGDMVTRCYSLCRSPSQEQLTIGVKKVQNGILSTYLNNELKAGDELTVAGPFGDFIYAPENIEVNANAKSQHGALSKSITLIAGGGGITPILSILESVLGSVLKSPLQGSQAQKVHLIYANRSHDSVMFRGEIASLQKSHPDSLRVSFVYSQTPENWKGDTACLNPEHLDQEHFNQGHLRQEQLLKMISDMDNAMDGFFYVCGPDALKKTVLETLKIAGVAQGDIMLENFVADTALTNKSSPSGKVHKVDIELANGALHQIDVAENQTVLQAARTQAIKIPYACGVGQCGCCMMRVQNGKCDLASDDTPGLLPEEQAQGLTLACQCLPRSALMLKQSKGLD